VAIRPTSYFSHLFATWTLFIESQSYRVAKKDTARIAVSDGPKLVQRPSVSLPNHMNRFYKFFLSLCTEKVELLGTPFEGKMVRLLF